MLLSSLVETLFIHFVVCVTDATTCRGSGVSGGNTDGLAIGGCAANNWLYNGFLYMQYLVDNALIRVRC